MISSQNYHLLNIGTVSFRHKVNLASKCNYMLDAINGDISISCVVHIGGKSDLYISEKEVEGVTC